MLKKNIIILGSNKTGKTTLAKKINEKYGCQIQSTKNILKSMEKTYPNDSAINYINFENQFLIDYVNRLSSGPDFIISSKNVIEMDTINIENLLNNIDRDRNLIIGLSHGEIDSELLFKNIRSNEGDLDITHFLSDESLNSMINRYLEDDKKIVDLCKKNNIKIFITSNNREEILEDINNNLGLEPNKLILK